MIEDQLLGALAVALGVGLILGHRYVDRQMAEADEERMERSPLLRKMQEAAKRQSPRWLASEGFTRGYNRFTLIVVGVVLAGIGIKLVLRGF